MDKNQQIIKAFQDFKNAAANLNEAWLNYNGEGNEFISKYPFDQTFDDVARDISAWADKSISSVNS